MKLSKDKRDKLILIALGFAGAIGVLYTFVLGVQNDTLSTLKKQILITQDKLSKAERLVQNKQSIESDLLAARKTLEAREESMAPQGQYYYWFLKQIDQFREQKQLNPTFITDISQPEFIDAGLVPTFPYKAASFGLRLNGPYYEVGKFIADLENTYPYFRVQNIRMVPQSDSQTASQASQAPGTQEEGNKLNVELRVVTLIRGGTT